MVVASNQNVDCCLIFELMRKLVTVFRSYFGKFDEEHIKEHFVLIYELLDGNSLDHLIDRYFADLLYRNY